MSIHVVESSGRRRPVWGAALAVLATGIISCEPTLPSVDPLPPNSLPPQCTDGCGLPPTSPAIGLPLPPVVTSAVAPPAISGGTLLVTRDGSTAVAADPERDQVWVVDLGTRQLVSTLALQPGDEPGRLVEDGAGRVHVALRRAGAVATLERTDGWHVTERRAACASPRGIAWDAAASALHVACQEGVLVTLPPTGTEGVRQQQVAPDLRDVVVQGGRVWLSRLKSAEVLGLGADGTVQTQWTPPLVNTGTNSAPSVAWRMVGSPAGLTVAHQYAQVDPVSDTTPGGYGGGGKPPIVQAAVTDFSVTDAPRTFVLRPGSVLPVDVSVAPSGNAVAVVLAGSNLVQVGQQQRILEELPVQEPVAVAFASDSLLLVLTRSPSLLVMERTFSGTFTSVLSLPGESRQHTGHLLFHRDAGAGVACASCHPEGGEDGRTWNFVQAGPRRTQPLWGGILDTAPFHWNGELPDMSGLMGEVFVRRMGGSAPGPEHVQVLGQWLDTVKVPNRPAPVDAAAVERGRQLFESAEVGCASCHAGAKGTTPGSLAVGTGGAFQVPHLMGLVYRAPFLHTGCASTLRERFGPCGGGDSHGRTSQLSEVQLGDLLAYLQTL